MGKLILGILVLLLIPLAYALEANYGQYYYFGYYIDGAIQGSPHNSTLTHEKVIKLFTDTSLKTFATGFHDFTLVISTTYDMSNIIYNMTYTNGIANGLGNFTAQNITIIIGINDINTTEFNRTYLPLINLVNYSDVGINATISNVNTTLWN